MLNPKQVTAFGPIRKLIWPIYAHEHKKFIPILFMFFLVSFVYNVLRTMKDTLVITAEGSGAEVIPFIKVWAMFPGAVLMTFIFTWLSNRFSKESVFYILTSSFLIYFLLFVVYLFPNHDTLHFHHAADVLQSILPAGCKGFITMFRHWTFTTFYVAAELWGNIILIVLFWGFVNQVTKLDEAKRFYGLFGLGANISCIFSSQVSVYLSKTFDPQSSVGTTAWEHSLFMLLSLVLICGILTIILFYWMNRTVLKDPNFYCQETARQEKEMKGTISFKESIVHLLRSPYLLYIAAIVIGYNIVINLVEVLWKDQIRLLHPDPNDYNLYFNQVSTWIGVVATLSAVFVSSNAIRIFGWTFTALITPTILTITSLFFFGFLFGQDYLNTLGILVFGMSPLALTVFIGSVQNVLSRGSKYTVFDATKEMAFVPLSTECKIKGKAIIDGICNRLGKSGGSVIHQTLLILFSSFAVTAPYIAGILFIMIAAWVCSVKRLGKAFNNLTGVGQDKPVDTAPAPTYEEPKIVLDVAAHQEPEYSR